MKRIITLLVAGLSVAGLFSTAGSAQQAGRQSTRVVRSLDPVKGNFHRLHTRKLKLSCSSCHSGDSKDILFLRRNDVVPAAMPGQVDREVCLNCHKSPAKPSWYGLGR